MWEILFQIIIVEVMLLMYYFKAKKEGEEIPKITWKKIKEFYYDNKRDYIAVYREAKENKIYVLPLLVRPILFALFICYMGLMLKGYLTLMDIVTIPFIFIMSFLTMFYMEFSHAVKRRNYLSNKIYIISMFTMLSSMNLIHTDETDMKIYVDLLIMFLQIYIAIMVIYMIYYNIKKRQYNKLNG